jgi:hypothetical protein
MIRDWYVATAKKARETIAGVEEVTVLAPQVGREAGTWFD